MVRGKANTTQAIKASPNGPSSPLSNNRIDRIDNVTVLVDLAILTR